MSVDPVGPLTVTDAAVDEGVNVTAVGDALTAVVLVKVTGTETELPPLENVIEPVVP